MMNEFKPTYLYIKQHKITGKLYFGKTVNNPEKYYGSGVHWKNHLKAHGKEIETIWYCLFYDQEECIKFAYMFSEQQNIVESTEWLNMGVERGVGGGYPPSRKGIKHTTKHNERISESNRDIPRPSIAGSNNPRAKEWIFTNCITNEKIITKDFTKFCNEHSINYRTLKSAFNNNKATHNYKVSRV